MIHRARVFPVSVAAVTIAVVIFGGMSLGHGHRILAVPAGTAIVIAVLAFVACRRAGRSAAATGSPAAWREAAWLMSILPIVLLLGVVAGSALYLFACLLKHGIRPMHCASAGLLTGLAVHLVFNELLDARLYAGLAGWP